MHPFSRLGLSRASAVFSLLTASLLMSPLTARAGHYTVAYTGGNCAISPDPYHNSSPYRGGYYYGSGGGAGCSPDAQGNATTCSVVCSGTITATFTWVPDNPSDDPPVNAIVQQNCSATWMGGVGNGGALIGFVDNGLGGPVIGTGPYGGFSQSVKYTVQDNTGQADKGATFSINCTPSVTINGASGTQPGSSAGGGGGVQYTAAASPVTVTLLGATLGSDLSPNFLIGQGCSAVMSAGPATLSNYSWAMGGGTFASFEMGTTPGDTFSPPHPFGRVHWVDPAEYHKPSPHWYWKKGGDDKPTPLSPAAGDAQTVVGVADASINGVSIGRVAGGTTAHVWQPYHKFSATPEGVNVVNVGTPAVEVVGNIAYSGWVGTPDLFRSYWGNSGVWQFTQLCSIDRESHRMYSVSPTPDEIVETNGLVLDAEFNYSSKDQGNPPTPWAADSTDTAPDEKQSGDAPNHALNGDDSSTVNDHFETFMMYLPPGSDVQWVPLHMMAWSWQCSGLYFDPLHGTWGPTPPGTIQVLTDNDTSDFPTWDGYYKDENP